ncbi:hypothetical protein CHS0354_004655 [Potamilus streckersoni]|uniref:Uncharacterized protein n=1 Tax=Potamilus streckersoni TaxID=2493646 RepID=A0AAE0VQK6_9BIVA|nr:hypothetical protein CHS0354_004655 [Potamilus streckersoni]
MMAETDPNLNLCVSEYHQGILRKLHSLQKQGCVCDVRLTAENGSVEAHKVILIASSKVLQQRLSRTPSGTFDNIHFDGIPHLVLKNVVDYIYTGNLSVPKNSIQIFLNFCEDLGLREAALLCREFISSDKGINTNDSSRVEIALKTSHTKHFELKNAEEANDLPKKEYFGLKQNRRVNRKPRKRPQTEDTLNLENIKPPTAKIPNVVISRKTSRASVSSNHSRTLRSTSLKSTKQTLKPNTKPNNISKPSRKERATEIQTLKGVKKGRSVKKIGKREKASETKDFSELYPNVLPSAGDVEITKVEHLPEKDDEDDKTVKEEINSASDDENETEREKEDNTDHVNVGVQESMGTTQNKHAKVCETCGVDFPNKKSLLKHMKSEHEGSLKNKRASVWPCVVCGRPLTSAVRQACHHFSKHGIPYDDRKFKIHKCTSEGCNYVTASKHYLQIHQRGRHGNERPHVCEFCGKGFKLPSALMTHLNIHTKEQVFRCDDCGQSFNQKGGLDVHIKKHHEGEASWTELCHLCSVKFLQKADLSWHMYKVHDVPLPERYKVYSCDLCNYQTIRRNKLERHMDAHDDKRLYTCEVCNKKFVTKSYLNRHVKYHGEKKFKCNFEECSYACVDQVGLNKHIRLMHTHKDYKPYVCTLCLYKTGLRGNLDKHIRSVHNLDVVTKHTVHLKMKFKDRKSGDIINKEGELVYSLQDKKINECHINPKFQEMITLQNVHQSIDLLESPDESQQIRAENHTAAKSEMVSILPTEGNFMHSYCYPGQPFPATATAMSLNLSHSDLGMQNSSQTQQSELYQMDPFAANKFTEYY